MTDLWTEASRDLDTERLETSLTTARVAAAAVWPFLAAAETPADFLNRKALASDRIERIAAAATEGDPALFSAVHAGLIDGLDEDFTVLHTERVASKLAALTASRAEQRRRATLREAIERRTIQQVLAASDTDDDEDTDDSEGEDGNLDGLPEAFKDKAKQKSNSATDDDTDSDDDEGEEGDDDIPEFIKKKMDKDSSRRKVAADAEFCICGDEKRDHPEGKGRCSICNCEGYISNDTSKASSRRTAGVYCNTHDVWIGDGNADTHEGCSKEQKATEKTKDASRKVAALPAGTKVINKNQPDFVWVSTGESASGLSNLQQSEPGTWFEPENGSGNRRIITEVDLERYGFEVVSRRKTAGENPFPPKDQGNDNTKPVEDEQTGTWVCPNCQATDAYTQGGKDLKEALDAGEPVKCGSCQQVDSSGGQAAQQQAPAPSAGATPPNVTSRRRTAAESMTCPDCGGDGVPLGDEGVDGVYEKCGTCDGTGSVPFSEYPGDRTFESSRRLIASGYTPSTVKYEVRDNDRLIATVPTREQAMRVLMQRGEWEGFGSTYDKDGTKTGDGLQVWEVTTGGQAGYDTAMDQHMDPQAAGEKRIARSRLPFVGRHASHTHVAANPYADSNPYGKSTPEPGKPATGIPDDLTDGPTTQPVTTRPRQAPSGPPAPKPVTQGFASRSTLKESS